MGCDKEVNKKMMKANNDFKINENGSIEIKGEVEGN